jgi:hypothetical protein
VKPRLLAKLLSLWGAARLECKSRSAVDQQLNQDNLISNPSACMPTPNFMQAQPDYLFGGAPQAANRYSISASCTGPVCSFGLSSAKFKHRMTGDGTLFQPVERGFASILGQCSSTRPRSVASTSSSLMITSAEGLSVTGRAADARAVLAPALEGFLPTPEFPGITEAQELLAHGASVRLRATMGFGTGSARRAKLDQTPFNTMWYAEKV